MYFNHLNYPAAWRAEYSKYPEGLTILESLMQWIRQVDDMVDSHNANQTTINGFGDRLDSFVAQYGEHLQATITETLSSWQASGFLDVVIDAALQTEMDNLVITTEQAIDSFSQELEQSTAITKNQARPFTLNGYLAITDDTATGNIKTDAQITRNIDDLALAKVDTFSICMEIQPDYTQQTQFASSAIPQSQLLWKVYPSIENLNRWLAYAETKGLKLGIIKFHSLWAGKKSDMLNLTAFMIDYKRLVLETVDAINVNMKPKHVTLINEAPKLMTEGSKPTLKTLMLDLQSRGYQTGLSGTNVPTDLVSTVDNFYMHHYPTITIKGNDATYPDGLKGWESSFIKEKQLRPLKKLYPDKGIIISEAGADYYWESLAQPEKWWGGTAGATIDPNGLPKAIFADGGIRYFFNENLIDEYHVFWTDSIQTELLKVFRNYKEGKYNV